MKKSIKYSTIVVAALMAVTPIISMGNFENSPVQAASSTKKLTRNAAVYNINGKRIGKKTLKKNKRVKIHGTKNINGKAYYKIGKNSYVRTVNFKKSSSKSGNDWYAEEMKKRSNDPTLNNYRDLVLKNSTSKHKVTVLFNKDSYSYYEKGKELKVVDKMPAGTEITIVAPSVVKIGNEYYLSNTGDDNTNYYKLSDLSFNGYDPDHDAKLKSLQKQVDKLSDKSDDGDILMTPKNSSVPQYDTDGDQYFVNKPVGVLSKPTTVAGVEVIRHNQKYYYTWDDDNGNYGVNVDDVTLSPAPAEDDED